MKKKLITTTLSLALVFSGTAPALADAKQESVNASAVTMSFDYNRDLNGTVKAQASSGGVVEAGLEYLEEFLKKKIKEEAAKKIEAELKRFAKRLKESFRLGNAFSRALAKVEAASKMQQSVYEEAYKSYLSESIDKERAHTMAIQDAKEFMRKVS